MKIEVIGGEISAEEQAAYIEHIKERSGRTDIESVIIRLDGDFVNLEWSYIQMPFDRIRRITGYLVGTIDRFNDGKRAEEADRVHHGFDDDYFHNFSGLIDN